MSDPVWTVRRLRADDEDLGRVVSEINGATMDGGEPLGEQAFATFLADERNVYLTVHIDGRLAGTLHAIQHLHPSGRRELYVDEVDTDAAFRRRGVAASMMRTIIDIAREDRVSAVWLCTEPGNEAANALYGSLDPHEVEPVAMYTFPIAPTRNDPA